MSLRFHIGWIAILLLAFTAAAAAQDLTIAAAADLQFAFQDVAAKFEKSTNSHVKLTFGSSGNFFAQIQNGAPFDLFFSADIDYPKRLETAGLADPGSLYRYATGKIVLWVLKDSPVDVTQGLSVLTSASVKKIAIANPEHAPYGRAAVAALKHENLYDKVSPKFVLGENISQTASFIVAGSADAGIVALSLALAPTLSEKGKYFTIPQDDYPPIEQAAVILKGSPQKDMAKKFIAFLQTPQILEVMRKYGFVVGQKREGY